MVFYLLGFFLLLSAVVERGKALLETRPVPSSPSLFTYPDTEEVKRAEQLEQALVETCKTLYFTGRNAGCNPDTNFTWSFLLENGIEGSLSGIYDLPTSPVFSCASPGAYGRFIFTRAIPREEVAGYNYSLKGLNTVNAVDPCGHAEIVGGL